MRRFAIALRSLRDMQWLVLWFAIGLALYAGSMAALFPLFKDALGEVEYPPEILQFFGSVDLADPAGFITVEYQSFAVLILIVYGLVAATGQLAGEEGRGTLETLLAHPVSRTCVMLEKTASVLAGLVAILLVISVGWLVTYPVAGFDGELTLLALIGATFGAIPAVLFFTALAFLLGAIAPARGSAAGIMVALAVLSYLVASLAQVVSAIEWAQYLSPYYYADVPRWLTEGPVWWHQGVLLAAALMLFIVALRAFERREVAAGVWQLRAVLGR